MKETMVTINMVVVLISIGCIVWNLIDSNFGIAWLYVIPFIYGWWNIIAITEDDK